MNTYEIIIGRTTFERLIITAKDKEEAEDIAWDEEGNGTQQYWDDQADIIEINEAKPL